MFAGVYALSRELEQESAATVSVRSDGVTCSLSIDPPPATAQDLPCVDAGRALREDHHIAAGQIISVGSPADMPQPTVDAVIQRLAAHGFKVARVKLLVFTTASDAK
jgi:hypothetical protein